MKLKLTAWGNEHEITLKENHYADNNNLAIAMYCWEDGCPEPWSVLTVNLGIKCRPNCAFIDTNNNGEDIVDWLEINRLAKPTGRLAPSGYCLYPEYEFNMREVQKYAE